MGGTTASRVEARVASSKLWTGGAGMLARFPFAPNASSEPRRVVPPLAPSRVLGWARRVGDDPCPDFSPGAQDRLTLGQVLFAQETYPTSDPKDYRLGNCYFHQDL
jgi:hypothetical protein